VLVFVHVAEKEAEEGVREYPRDSRVGEVAVDYEDGDEGEEQVEAEGVEADECVLGPEDALGKVSVTFRGDGAGVVRVGLPS